MTQSDLNIVDSKRDIANATAMLTQEVPDLVGFVAVTLRFGEQKINSTLANNNRSMLSSKPPTIVKPMSAFFIFIKNLFRKFFANLFWV